LFWDVGRFFNGFILELLGEFGLLGLGCPLWITKASRHGEACNFMQDQLIGLREGKQHV
jgi:hypothetical protein